MHVKLDAICAGKLETSKGAIVRLIMAESGRISN